jgi:dolichol-phosphate mannosyltransferase
MGVQLGVLFLLTSAARLNYLISTALAVETAVMHNFLWHQRFTWRDRGETHVWQSAGRLLRFNAGNGAISLLGNVALMRLLVGEFHIRVIVANLISIGACAIANFIVSDRWVFLAVARQLDPKQSAADAISLLE